MTPLRPPFQLASSQRVRARCAFPAPPGPFAFQENNDTRRFEYPWAYFATSLRPGFALEIGGGLSGFQSCCRRQASR